MHITTACLSVLGSLFVLVTYHLIPTHRGVSLRIVYWLSVSDLVTSFVYIVDGGTTANEDGSARCPDGLCVVLALTRTLTRTNPNPPITAISTPPLSRQTNMYLLSPPHPLLQN